MSKYSQVENTRGRREGMASSANINAVFYPSSYHPIQAGSIDGTDVTPHDNAIYRALLCASTGLYDPTGDPKVIGDPYCTVFVGRLSRSTAEESLQQVMSKYGRVKSLRLVRHIVTGASQGYAFVEYETEREMRHAYEAAHHSIIDGSEVIVDYNRQQLMPGWIPRRLGGGLGGRKESGQLRFGGRERPFRAPLRPIPHEELQKLGIPLPPEGRYMSRVQIPPLPRHRSPDKHHHRHLDYSSAGLSKWHGDASEKASPDSRLDKEKTSKPSRSSLLANDKEEQGVLVAKESTRSVSCEDEVSRERTGEREGSMFADKEEDAKYSRHRHHKHRSHPHKHSSHHHERKRKESRHSEHDTREFSDYDQIDGHKWKRRHHQDDYSSYTRMVTSPKVLRSQTASNPKDSWLVAIFIGYVPSLERGMKLWPLDSTMKDTRLGCDIRR